MPTLKEVLERKRRTIEEKKRRRPADAMLEGPAQDHAKISFVQSVRNGHEGNVIIAEFKRASLTKTFLDGEEDPASHFEAYQNAGAAAVSVLTEEHFFHGDLADIETAKRCVDVPVLMKDFVLDEYQICEGLGAGADMVLLIVRLLSDQQLEKFHALTQRLKIEALVEVCSPEDLRRALVIEPELIGVNSRDLDTLRVDTGMFEEMAPLLPAGAVKIAESGIRSPDQIPGLRRLGYDGFLIGEALMAHGDPAGLLRSFVEAK
ncbi:MAG: indole-3-glycerol-phosphate synthase [Nitrospirae bacterium]|nr:indole-3-glycerol-phosphate synthase [Nitrospirota bacterium]